MRVCVFIYVYRVLTWHVSHSVHSRLAAWIFQRLRIDFYRFPRTPKQTPTHFTTTTTTELWESAKDRGPKEARLNRISFEQQAEGFSCVYNYKNISPFHLSPLLFCCLKCKMRPAPTKQPLHNVACKCLMYLICWQRMLPLVLLPKPNV